MEIEIRAKVDSLEEMKEKLISMGAKVFGSKFQHDVIYKREDQVDTVQKPGSFILRVRESSTGHKLTFKSLTDVVGSWIEHETKIEDPKETRLMLEKSGFVPVLVFDKEREEGKLGEITFCLDRMPELGEFIELEIISDDVDAGKKKLLELILKLGYSEKDIIHKGYVAILMERQGVKYENTG
ncbi:class IV adenylate cyclase [archaeon]|jgi:adenylate cyclase, class 2|nr:class IV adenylate cyclase [archaeon]MBT6761696.1 class IV adenylate cyclase [archaeon]